MIGKRREGSCRAGAVVLIAAPAGSGVDGVENTVNIKQGNALLSRADRLSPAWRNIVGLRRKHKFGHGHPPLTIADITRE